MKITFNMNLILPLLLFSLYVHTKIMWYSGLLYHLLDVFCICTFCCSLLYYLKGLALRRIMFIELLDKYSMSIYLLHQILIMVLFEYTVFEDDYLNPHPYLYIPLLLCSILAISLLLSIVKKYLKIELYL